MPDGAENAKISNLLIELTSDIVSSFVSNNEISASDLPDLISGVYCTLSNVHSVDVTEKNEQEPAVPINKSYTRDYIICLEDGKKLKMLKRYLRTQYDMTPEDYREKWKLPANYPMVAPSYSKKRSAFAKEIGLGRRGE